MYTLALVLITAISVVAGTISIVCCYAIGKEERNNRCSAENCNYKECSNCIDKEQCMFHKKEM